MTIREVIAMLSEIFKALMEILAPLFNKSEGEGEESDAPAEV